MERVVGEGLAAWLDAHPEQAKAILVKARKAASGRAIYRFGQGILTRRA